MRLPEHLVFCSVVFSDDAVIRVGLKKPIDIRLIRKELTKNSPITYAINTDDQLKTELPLINSGSDITQGKKW